ncbi:MFS transporter [Paenibacillus sp. GCM10012307]|uniref:MFS transporter n=1 Tax=Paenibacillus roseus TaxID=2798579 RepID=A0A934IZB3_9BACL|nr:MFS transporter [Paenibacillus roseus]MBJ6359820.1 MFS transporter [Paenibacillus roseus]
MEQWKVNLIVLWFGQFLVMAGMTMIVPFLSLYLQNDLGLQGEHTIGTWAGLIFAGNFVTSFVFQPLWGKLSDRYGRKVMLLRSGFGMAVVMTLMGFATSPWHLLALRLINGTISGFNPASISLISSTTPKEKMGYVMGTLQSGAIAGTILGPFFGGIMADAFGYRPIFYITGALLFLASLLAMFTVKENFDKEKAQAIPQISVVQGLRELTKVPQLTALYAVTFMIQYAMISPMPLIPLFVQHLHGTAENVAFWAGFVGSVTGLSNMVSAPLLGKLGDRIGPEKILGIALFGSAILFIPQAFVGAVWQLLIVRFLLGIFLGGLLPTVNSLIRRFTPEGRESRAYSFNSSMLSLGSMVGPVTGGLISGWVGISGVFLISSAMFFLNFLWVRRSLYHSDGQSVIRGD